MTRKKPTVPAELPPARPLPDTLVPNPPEHITDGDLIITPYGGHIYSEAEQRWLPIPEPAEPVRATLERIDEPAPVGWVPTPPDADTPWFNEVNAEPPTPPHHCGRRDDHPHRWEALLAASKADTAALRAHFNTTMADSTL